MEAGDALDMRTQAHREKKMAKVVDVRILSRSMAAMSVLRKLHMKLTTGGARPSPGMKLRVRAKVSRRG